MDKVNSTILGRFHGRRGKDRTQSDFIIEDSPGQAWVSLLEKIKFLQPNHHIPLWLNPWKHLSPALFIQGWGYWGSLFSKVTHVHSLNYREGKTRQDLITNHALSEKVQGPCLAATRKGHHLCHETATGTEGSPGASFPGLVNLEVRHSLCLAP